MSSSSSSSPKRKTNEEKETGTNPETSESSSSATEKAANTGKQARQDHEHSSQKQPGPHEATTSTATTTSAPSTMEALTATIATAAPPPAYGLQSYWEERYSALLRSTYSSSVASKRVKTSVRKQQQQDESDAHSSPSIAGRKRGADALTIDTSVMQKQKVPKLEKPPQGGEVDIEDVDEDLEEEEEDEEGDDDEDHPLAGHEWYFSYHELRPLLLPLILGRDLGPSHFIPPNYNDNEEENEDNNEAMELGNEEDQNETEDVDRVEDAKCEPKNTNLQEREKDEQTSASSSGPATRRSEEEEESGTGEAEQGGDVEPAAQLPIKGPQKILEVGCGEVPLGQGIWKDMLEMQQTTGANARLVVSEIHCTDYSTVMIDILRQKQQEQLQQKLHETAAAIPNADVPTPVVPHGPPTPNQPSSSSSSSRVPPAPAPPPEMSAAVQPSLSSTSSSSFSQDEQLEITFSVMDARRMNFPNETFNLVMDKGTLDAMLSDKTHGSANCIAIVSEMARVLRVDGYMVIISHLNANTPQGLEWLHEVVIGGIHQSTLVNMNDDDGVNDEDENLEIKWEIEVHGRDQPLVPMEQEEGEEEEDQEETNDKDTSEETPSAPSTGEAIQEKGKKEDEKDADTAKSSKDKEGEDDEDEEPRSDWPQGVLGPAVYIVHKFLGPSKKEAKSATTTDGTAATSGTEEQPQPPSSPPSIPLKFFVY